MQMNERKAREAVEKQQNDDDNLTEMANNIYGDILTENPAQAQSAFGPHRVIPASWKGMTPEQIADIKRMQELQRKEKEVELWVLYRFTFNYFPFLTLSVLLKKRSGATRNGSGRCRRMRARGRC